MARPLDHLIAVHVFGLEAQTVQPTWYKLPVTLYRYPGDSIWTYSYDDDACNACMHRNGVDDRDGTARPLPFWANEMEYAWEVVEQMKAHGFAFQFSNEGNRNWAHFAKDGAWGEGESAADEPADAIALAALHALGVEVPAP